MRRLLSLPVLAAVIALAIPATATAASDSPQQTASKVLLVQPGTPLAAVQSWDSVPLHFHASAGYAVTLAEHTPALQRLHRRLHPLQFYPYVFRAQHPFWYVVFDYHNHIVASANVSPAGRLIGVWTGLQATAMFAHGGYSWVLSGWMVLVPASLLFLIPFLDPRRLLQISHLDGIAILTFLVSWVLLTQAKLEPAVWTAYPPLIYLLVRLIMVGFGRAGGGRIAPLLSMRVLMIGLPLIIIARALLSLLGHQEIDVGYESVIGASRITQHLPIYYPDASHGDTYGPVAYLTYVPFELIFPWKNSLSNLHAADVAAVFFDFGTMLALFLLGRGLREGREGTRLGLVLAWGWAACPFTTIGLIVHTNDALISMLCVFALVAYRSRLLSSGLLGLAAAAKFSPAALVPLLAAPRQRGLKGSLVYVSTFTTVVALAIFSWLPPGGLSYFWQRTIGFQLTRFDVFSPWALHGSLRPVQTALEVLAVLFIAALAFVPRRRSLASVCALAGAATIAIQLPATHWYYYYIMWFVPFALVAFVARPALVEQTADEAAVAEDTAVARPQGEPALAGA